MNNSKILLQSRLHKALMSLIMAMLLGTSGLFLIGQMSKTGSGENGIIGEEPSEMLPDLTISHRDITFSNDNPTEGDIIEICATVYNIGNDSAIEVVVDFYDHFAGTGKKIGSKIIPKILPGTNETTCVSWTAQPAGLHGILVKVDPENLILESNEQNNVADRGIEVLPRQESLPDLTIDGGIHFSNNHPREGETINICVTVVNIGHGAADNIEVLFLDIFERMHKRIGMTLIGHLDPNDYGKTCHEWKAQPAGEHGIVVKVDPENKIQETNEQNNVEDARIVVFPQEEQTLFVMLVRFDNDGNGRLDDVVIVVYNREHDAIVGAEVFIDNYFYGRTPDSGAIMAYNFSHGWHVVKVHFNGVEIQGQFFSQG